MRYYNTQVQFETVNDQNGKIQKTKEHYLVEALNHKDCADKLNEKFAEGMSEFRITKIDESNIMGVIK